MKDAYSRIRDNNCFVLYAANEMLLLGGVHEEGYLLNEHTREVFSLGWFYGNPLCGLIAGDNTWALMGGRSN